MLFRCGVYLGCLLICWIGDLTGGGVGVLFGEAVGVVRGILDGGDLSEFLHVGWSIGSSMIKV